MQHNIMPKRTLSLWRVLVFSILTFFLVYFIPNMITLTNVEKTVNSQIELFNNDAESFEYLNSDSLKITNSGDYDFDVSNIQETYNYFLLDSHYFIEDIQRPNNKLWDDVVYGELIVQIVKIMTNNIIKSNVWNYLICFSIFVIISSIICYFLSKIILKETLSVQIRIEKIKSRLDISNSLYFVLLFGLGVFFIILSGIVLERFINPNTNFFDSIFGENFISTYSFDLKAYVKFLIPLLTIYYFYLFTVLNSNKKLNILLKVIDTFILIEASIAILYLLIFSETSILKRIISIISESYDLFFKSDIINFVSKGTISAYYLITMIVLLSSSVIIYILIKFCFTKGFVERISILLKHTFTFLTFFFVITTLSVKVEVLNEMVDQQSLNRKQQQLILKNNIISASTYQWYHNRIDNNLEVNEFNDELISSLSELDNVIVTTNWKDGILTINLENFAYKDDEYHSIFHTLNAKTGETDIKFSEDNDETENSE